MKIILLNLSILLVVFKSFSQTTYPTGASGCIARWTFDTTESNILTSLPDKSNNGNNGSTYNIASVNGFKGIPHDAGGFDGAVSWCEVQHSNTLNVEEHTIISLVKIDQFINNQCQGTQIISKGYPYNIPGNYGQVFSDNPYDGSCISFSPTNNQLCTQRGTNVLNYPAGNYIEEDKWYFLASVIKDDTIKQYQLFMDSLNMASSIASINMAIGSANTGVNNQNISIGKHLNPQYEYWLNGSIDEIVLFNRALSNQEVFDVYCYLWGAPTSVNTQRKTNVNLYYYDWNVYIKTSELNYTIEIYNEIGQMVAKRTKNSGNSIVDVSRLNEGLYFARLITWDNQIINQKIVHRK